MSRSGRKRGKQPESIESRLLSATKFVNRRPRKEGVVGVSARATGSINSLFAWQVLRCLVTTSVDDARSIREAGRKNSNRSKIRGKLGRTVERSYTRDRL